MDLIQFGILHKKEPRCLPGLSFVADGSIDSQCYAFAVLHEAQLSLLCLCFAAQRDAVLCNALALPLLALPLQFDARRILAFPCHCNAILSHSVASPGGDVPCRGESLHIHANAERFHVLLLLALAMRFDAICFLAMPVRCFAVELVKMPCRSYATPCLSFAAVAVPCHCCAVHALPLQLCAAPFPGGQGRRHATQYHAVAQTSRSTQCHCCAALRTAEPLLCCAEVRRAGHFQAFATQFRAVARHTMPSLGVALIFRSLPCPCGDQAGLLPPITLPSASSSSQ